MGDHIADAGKMVPDPIEQAARVARASLLKTNLTAVEVVSISDRIVAALHEAGMLVGGEPVAWRWTDQGIRFMAYPWEERPDYAEALYALPTEDRSDG